MNRPLVLRSLLLLPVLAAMIVLLSCSGGEGGGAAPDRVQLSGTVASEEPITADALIGFRDNTGKLVFVSTNSDGTFFVDLAALGLTLPVIFRVPNPATGKFMYGFASAEGTANLHPLTDPILRIWFRVKGRTGSIDNDFISTTSFPLPTADEIGFIKSLLELITGDFLKAAGVDPGSFDLMTSAFVTNGTGFDSVLKGLRVDATDTGAVTLSVVPFSALDTAVTGSGYASWAAFDPAVLSLGTDTTPPDAPTGLYAASLCGGKALITWSTPTSNDAAAYQVYEETKGRIATVTSTAYIAGNLTTMGTYTFSVRAVDAAGNLSLPSAGDSVDLGPCMIPGAPNALSTAPTISVLSSSRLRLDWTDNQSNILEYRVYSAGTPSTLIARTMSRTFTDFQLLAGTSYCYAVTLVNSFGESDPSTPVCGTTVAGVPPAPRNVAAAATGTGQVTVTWDAVANAASYKLYSAVQTGLTKNNYATLTGGTLVSGITGTSRTVTSLVPGSAYHFVVTAVNGSGESVESAEVSATP